MKQCSKCKITKPKEAFNKNKSKKDGLQNQCKQCHCLTAADHYKTHKAQHKALTARRNKRICDELKEFIFQYLKDHPCVDCAESDPIVLDFDHVRGTKTTSISNMIRSFYSQNTIAKEIEKCEVRCANCHRRKTARQFGWFKLNRKSSGTCEIRTHDRTLYERDTLPPC